MLPDPSNSYGGEIDESPDSPLDDVGYRGFREDLAFIGLRLDAARTTSHHLEPRADHAVVAKLYAAEGALMDAYVLAGGKRGPWVPR
jgi:hypothetical protein